ncbi:MAG: alpha/beta hydrolase [Bradyrhizobium sp.]|jgi:non-heme chloroperoxidase|uniref:alpha/beta fold hydrolase n=1 Tax=Bradyrhizobium sp. TaxID=376 RepID=UPI001216BF18|nr:alpha/beta hydrolase [Bradyrhizobium sp.]THD51594.1 MAG: alpha/beta hydrolase [Bradyrhizobium sp.]
MDRRTLMKSAASGAVGACLLGGMTDNAMNARAAAPPAKPHTGDFIETADGVKLAYTDWGSGKPVVFIHAWALPSPMWDYQIGALSQAGLRCIAYDRRGHGRSSKPGSGYDCDTLADDLSALLTQLDLRGVTLVSHSFGSCEIVRYLTRHGAGRIEKIVLIAPAALPFLTRTPDNPNGIPAEALEFFRSHVLQADFPKWLEEGRQGFFVADTSPSLQEWVKQLMLTTPLPVAIETSRRITSTDFRQELPGITVPTLIIHGDKDVSAPIDLTGRPTAALIPKAQFRVYEGAPHGIFLTHKDRLNADLLGFIKG